MKADQFSKMLSFLRDLGAARIHYRLRHSRDDAIMVFINVPGERWEVEFLEDGDIEVEKLTSTGHIGDETMLQELFAKHSDAISTADEGALIKWAQPTAKKVDQPSKRAGKKSMLAKQVLQGIDSGAVSPRREATKQDDSPARK